MMLEGDWTLDGEHTMQCADDVLQNCTLETYTIVLTKITLINSIKCLNQKRKKDSPNLLVVRFSIQ